MPSTKRVEVESSSSSMEKFTGVVSQLSTSVNRIKIAVSQIQATIARMKTRLSNLENGHNGYNYWGEGQAIEECKENFNAATFKHENDINQIEHVKEVQPAEDAKEEEGKTDIEDMDLTTSLVLSQEDLSIDSPHIDFIFGDQLRKFGVEQRVVSDCDLMVEIHHLKHPTVRSHICSNYGHRKKLYLKLCPETTVQPMERKFVQLIFDPGGYLPNLRSSAFQAGVNDVDGPQARCVGPK